MLRPSTAFSVRMPPANDAVTPVVAEFALMFVASCVPVSGAVVAACTAMPLIDRA